MHRITKKSTGKRWNSWKSFKLCSSMAFDDFCEVSSFHGVRYLSLERSCNWKRALWFGLLVILWITVGVFIFYLFERHMGAVTTTIVKTKFYPSSGIPFPAVTVCPPNGIEESELVSLFNNLIQKYNANRTIRMDIDVSEYSKDLIRLFAHRGHTDLKHLKDFDEILEYNNKTITELIEASMNPCNTLMFNCMWDNTRHECSKIFRSVIIPEGICCIFNYHGRYSSNTSHQYTNGFGFHSGIGFTLKFGNLSNTKARLFVHSPITFPSEILSSTFISDYQQLIIPVEVVRSFSDDNLREISSKVRECTFPEEYKLEYFIKYTFENCITECNIRRYYHNCSCIPHFYENIIKTGLRTCSFKDFGCVAEYYEDNKISKRGKEDIPTDCNCPTECDISIIQYDTNTVNIDTDINRLSRYLYIPIAENIDYVENYIFYPQNRELPPDVSAVKIYFSKSHFVLYNKILRYNGIHFMSSVGGLLSLFLGCSFISLIEILYIFGFRLIKNYHQIKSDMNVLYVTRKYLANCKKHYK